MKPLPQTIRCTNAMHGTGEHGMAFYVDRNEEFGVQIDTLRTKRGTPWIEAFTSDFLPHRTFATYRELREAVNNAIQRGDVLLTYAPVITGVESRGKGTVRCWICKGAWDHSVIVKTGWRDMDQSRIGCCAAHLDQVKADPLAAIECRRAQVRESDGVLAKVRSVTGDMPDDLPF